MLMQLEYKIHVSILEPQGITIIITPLKSLAIIQQTHRILTSIIKFSKKTHWSYNYQVISEERIKCIL